MISLFIAGKHEITIGTSNQLNKFLNGFAPNYNGLYYFANANDFMTNKPAVSYAYRNSALADGSFPFAKAFFLQPEFIRTG